MSLYQKLANIWHEPLVEPVKRNKDGLRWIVHHFPIKGGISLRSAMLQDMQRKSVSFHYLVNGSVKIIEHQK